MIYEQEYGCEHLSDNFLRWMRSADTFSETKKYWVSLWRRSIHPTLGTKKKITADEIIAFISARKKHYHAFELKALAYLLLSAAYYGKEDGSLEFEPADVKERVAALLTE